MRFDLVDAVLERSAERIVTVKAVTAAEEYLGDHFPGFPILPGVMMLECLVQAARRLLASHPDAPSSGPWVLSDARNVKYGNMVPPGQTLRVTVDLHQQDGTSFTFKGKGEVNGSTAVQGRFTLRPAGPSIDPNKKP